MSTSTFTYAGKTALITGASSGIGAEFARALASRGCNAILVARSGPRLDELAATLRTDYGVTADVITTDLTAVGAVEQLTVEIASRGLDVHVLINNAGFGTHGDLADADPVRIHDEVTLNVAALTDLTTAYLPAMTERRCGVIINVASTAAFQPVPHMAVYGATKAYVLSFTEALWWEARRNGVQVLALCPGATETNFFDVAGADAAVGRFRQPKQVVDTAFHALDHDRPSVVDGSANRLLSLASRFVPRRTSLVVTERAMR